VDSWAENGFVFLRGERLMPLSEIPIPGMHNVENCLAAAAAAAARNLDSAAIAEGLGTFAGVAHRLERAGIISGVTYVNDSKATNVEATLTALKAYPSGVHLILGGRDKASDYRPIAEACLRGCRGVYLIGEATPLIEAAFEEVRNRPGFASVPVPLSLGDLEMATWVARGRAVSGDTVLLAPACASFDQYTGFEERGEHFRTIVRRLGDA